jgi:hypothetical protein
VIRHYASSRFVFWALVAGLAIGGLAYVVLPSDAMPAVATLLRYGWVAFGAVAALSVQLAMKLISLGDGGRYSSMQRYRLSLIVNERLRYLWDLAIVSVLAMLTCVLAGTEDLSEDVLRVAVISGSVLTVWTVILAVRLWRLLIEIKDFLWRLAQDEQALNDREAALKEIRDSPVEPVAPPREIVHREWPESLPPQT